MAFAEMWKNRMSKENPVRNTVYYSTLTKYMSSCWQDLIQFFKVEKTIKRIFKSNPYEL